MKQSDFTKWDPPEPEDRKKQKRRNEYPDDEEGFIPRKKDSGKRDYRKNSPKEKLWDELTRKRS